MRGLRACPYDHTAPGRESVQSIPHQVAKSTLHRVANHRNADSATDNEAHAIGVGTRPLSLLHRCRHRMHDNEPTPDPDTPAHRCPKVIRRAEAMFGPE